MFVYLCFQSSSPKSKLKWHCWFYCFGPLGGTVVYRPAPPKLTHLPGLMEDSAKDITLQIFSSLVDS